MTQLQSWARALGGEVVGRSLLCPGPGHSRKDRSLAVSLGRNGEPVCHSFAGDDWRVVKDRTTMMVG
jgi:putative DNA primase/helicase